MPAKTKSQLEELTAIVLEGADPTLVQLVDRMVDRFGGVDGISNKALAVYEDPETSPRLKVRILEMISRLIVKVLPIEAGPDYSTLSTEQLEAAVQEIVVRRLGLQKRELTQLISELPATTNEPVPIESDAHAHADAAG